MEYKVLIRLFVPEIEETYEAYIPINKTVGEVAAQLVRMVNNLSVVYPADANIHLYNRYTGTLYGRSPLIRETDIKNGTELVLIS